MVLKNPAEGERPQSPDQINLDLRQRLISEANNFISQHIEPQLKLLKQEFVQAATALNDKLETAGTISDTDFQDWQVLRKSITDRVRALLVSLDIKDQATAEVKMINALLSTKRHSVQNNMITLFNFNDQLEAIAEYKKTQRSIIVPDWDISGLYIAPEELEIEHSDMNLYLKFSVSQRYSEAENKDIKIVRNEPSGKALADHYAIFTMEMMRELLRNAIAATPKGGIIKAETQSSPDYVIIIVADTGEGILEQNMKFMFDDRFTTKEERGGTGRGLALVKLYVEDMLGGKIEVKSELGKGTEFKIYIPKTGKKE